MSFSPTYDYTHAINGLKGWPMWQPLDTVGVIASSDAGYAVAGRIGAITGGGSINTPSSYDMGGAYWTPTISLGASAVQVPLVLHRSDTNYDVVNGATAASGAPVSGQTMGTYGWAAGIPTGAIGALVCTGPYEIESTEFDTTDIASMVPGQPLKAPTSAQGAASAGMLFAHRNWPTGGNGAVTLGTDTTVGFVSRGTQVNKYGVQVVAFWTDPVYGTQ